MKLNNHSSHNGITLQKKKIVIMEKVQKTTDNKAQIYVNGTINYTSFINLPLDEKYE